MGRFDVKNKDKAPSDANKRGKIFGSGITVWREAFAGTSKALNALQVKFNCGEVNGGGRFSEYLQLTTAYLSTKLEGDGDVKTSIRNGKVFEPAWPDLVRTNPATTKSMIQAEYGKRDKNVEKLCINLSKEYGLVLGQCTDYLWSHIQGQEKLETKSNKQELLGLLKSVKSLPHKYGKDTEYHHAAYHTLLRHFMLFLQGDYSNSEYKQRFKGKVEVLKSYNGGSYLGTSRELRRKRSQYWDWTRRPTAT